jgi:hypothetical protein
MSRSWVAICATLSFILCPSNFYANVLGQEGGTAKPTPPPSAEVELESLKIEIADEPKSIDPATLVMASLAKNVTVEFAGTSIREVVDWIRLEQGVTVLVDEAALASTDILLSDPVTEKLDNEPLYLLLERLRALDLSWYVEDDILHLTTVESANDHLTTVPHNVGSFFDDGFAADHLRETIMKATEYESWDELGGMGSLVLLGDVMFIRQTDHVHRKVSGLLVALNKHARRTFIDDPPQHEALRAKLEEKLSVDFVDTPLAEALAFLSEKSGAQIRLDTVAFRENRIRDREPVSLKLTNQKLSSILQALLVKLKLTWTLRDGSILITTASKAETFLKSAVFDVRDLCRNFDESDGLTEALMTQTQGDWDMNGGVGAIVFAKPGVMVVSQTEKAMGEVSTLLENYRAALKVSKVRDREKVDPKELVTRYYRMPTVMAKDLQVALKSLVDPESWVGLGQPAATGRITMVASRPVLIGAKGVQTKIQEGMELKDGLILEYSVLVVYQTRENQDKISSLIYEIEYGLPAGGAAGGMGGGMGGGGGGFGGGFFSIPDQLQSQSPVNPLAE